jgi:hypothetical protein
VYWVNVLSLSLPYKGNPQGNTKLDGQIIINRATFRGVTIVSKRNNEGK